MTPERWQQIKIIVNSALAADIDARTILLQQSCAEDLPLRLGAEALISFHEDATRRLAHATTHIDEANLQAPLSPDRWKQMEQLFQLALELDSAKRAAFLANACGRDDALRREVEELLVYQAAAGDVIGGAIQQAAGLLANSSGEKARFTSGMTLNKRYRIIGLLGRGGMGEVYRADDLKLGLPVALKFLTEKFSQNKGMLERFYGEVSMAHRVTHPNVCRVHDIGEVTTSSGNLHFLSMEYVDGEDLSSLLRRIGRLPSDKAIEIANQICAGLAAAHEAGVLHRDLKPANIMLDGKGRARITDFGLAGFAEQIRGREVMAGTPAYMAPEQFAGKEVTVKSDIYALGLVLYEVFTGKRVFEAGSLDELKRLHESSAPTNPSNWVKDIDPLVERVILRCLEKDPGRRLASAKQVADALPGGDPLAAALALGETPSPEMVVAAPLEGTLRPAIAVIFQVAILLGLMLFVLLADRVFPVTRSGPLEKSPEVLSERAGEIARKLGYREPPIDKAYGLDRDEAYLQYLMDHDSSVTRWNKVAAGEPAAVFFWYRQSPRVLVPYSRHDLTRNDPPLRISGAVDLTLDPRGWLRTFQAAPPQVDEGADSAPAPDWSIVFAEAGLDLTKFTQTTSKWVPPVNSDIRAAWEGTFPYPSQFPLRIEAAAYRGRLVYFEVIGPWHNSTRVRVGQPRASILPFTVFLLVLPLICALLVRQNLRLGRGDRIGAFRLALYLFVIQLLYWVFHVHHVPTPLEFDLLVTALAWGCFNSGIIWLFYMAFEPYVRRYWPHRIIAWSRLLAGNFCSPLIGRDVLLGGLFAICFVLLQFAVFWGARRFGFSEGVPLVTEPKTLYGLRGLIAVSLSMQLATILFVFSILFTLFLLSRLLRKEWLAFGVAWLGFTVIFGIKENSQLVVGWFLTASFVTCWMIILVRFGLLATVAFHFLFLLLALFPITSDFSAWYAQGTIFVLIVYLAICGYGFYTSLGGQKVFARKLLEE